MQFASHDREFIDSLVKAGIELGSIYDVGASNGLWSWWMATVAPHARFNLFEPLASDQYSPQLAKILQQRPDFRMHRVALGDANATMHIKVHRQHVNSTLLDWAYEVTSTEPVPVRRLDDFVAELGLPPPDVIKVDTQGYELKVLQGGETTCRAAKALMLESWLYRGYGPATPLLSELIEWLSERDFSLVRLGDSWIAPDQTLFSIDAFFLRNDIKAQFAKGASP